MEISSPKLKKLLYFLQKTVFLCFRREPAKLEKLLIFWGMKLLFFFLKIIFLMFQGMKLSSLNPEKKSYISPHILG